MAALIRRMAEAGASPEAIAIAVEAIEAGDAKEAARKAKRAEQKRRERDRVATVARQGGDRGSDIPPSDKEKSPEPPKEITSPHSPPKGGSYTPRVELEKVLDSERAQAVVEHRQRIRKPLTAHAAKVLAGKFKRCSDPNAAADEMISNGWQGFKPEWMALGSQRSTAPPRDELGAAVENIFRERGWTSEPELIPGDPGDAQRISSERGDRQAGPVVDLREGPDGSFGPSH